MIGTGVWQKVLTVVAMTHLLIAWEMAAVQVRESAASSQVEPRDGDSVPGPGPDDLSTRALTERILLVRRGGQNLIAIRSEKGIVLIDSGPRPDVGSRVREAVEDFFQDRIEFLVNTHSHWDHTFGNQVFSGALILAHESVAGEMERAYEGMLSLLREAASPPDGVSLPPPPPGGQVGNTAEADLPRLVDGDENESLVSGKKNHEWVTDVRLTRPHLAFADRLSLKLGDLSLELYYYGSGHSRGDIFILVPEEHFLAIGDIFYQDQVPPLRGLEKPQVTRWLSVIERILARDPKLRWIVPGHGALVTLAQFAFCHRYIETLWLRISSGVREGRDFLDVWKRLPLDQTLFPEVPFPLTAQSQILHEQNVEHLWRARELGVD